MKPASAKAKGRRLQNEVARCIRRVFGLSERDVRPAVMGANGADIKLSDEAARVFPYAIECKNTERLNIWSAIAQAEAHAQRENLRPLVIFTRNRAEVYVCVELGHFLQLASGVK